MDFTKEQIEKLGITYEEGMTNEDVLKALGDIKSNLDTLKSENAKQKDIISKRNSEIADFRKKEQENLSEEEKRNLEFETLKNKCADYEKQSKISERKSNYVGLGYSSELAEKVAFAEVEGKDTSKYHKEFIEAHDAQLQEKLMKSTPNPDGKGSGDNGKFTKENYRAGKISFSELAELKETNSTLYNEITK